MAHDGAVHAAGPVTCHVPGTPRSKGSTVSFFAADQQRIITKADSVTLAQWQRDIGWTMKGAMRLAGMSRASAGTPVCLELRFMFPGGTATPADADAITSAMIDTPDIDKLQRAVLDGLTGVLYDDDKQVHRVEAIKVRTSIAADAGVEITASFGQRVPDARTPKRADTRKRQGRAERRRSQTDRRHVRDRRAT